MKRRQFVGLSAYIAAAFSVPFLDGCTGSGNDMAVASPTILQRILNKKTIVETGQAYLKKHPQENSTEKLKNLLIEKSFTGSAQDEAALSTYFTKKIEADFNSDNTIITNGWVLALTEARQCALFSILQS